MRYLSVLFVALILGACNKIPDTRRESPPVNHDQTLASEQNKDSIDLVVQFLLTSAATDFHDHSPPDPIRFRDVRIGHFNSQEKGRRYILCGQFIIGKGKEKDEWTPFATIKTSDYEQWIGGPASGYCQDSLIIWDKASDLSSSLQNRLDSLR